MVFKKVVIGLVCSGLFFGTNCLAKKPDYSMDGYIKVKKNNKKIKKRKSLPYGLQKKLQRGGQLPPGWQKKLARGEVIDSDVLNQGIVLNSATYPYIKGTSVYQIQDKIVRVANATKVILDIFK